MSGHLPLEFPQFYWTDVAPQIQFGSTIRIRVFKGRFAPAGAVQAKSAFETLGRHRLRHLVITPISTIKIVTVAPDLCTRRVGAIEAIGDLEELVAPVVAGMEINRFRLRAYEVSLGRLLISDVDRSQKRLIVIRNDECASRVAITRGLVVQP